jgi:hypothetical protein
LRSGGSVADPPEKISLAEAGINKHLADAARNAFAAAPTGWKSEQGFNEAYEDWCEAAKR